MRKLNIALVAHDARKQEYKYRITIALFDLL